MQNVSEKSTTVPPATPWPAKTRDIHNHHMDSTVWDEFKFRYGDVVVATYAKSGTTWMQQIVLQLIYEGADISVANVSPWLDLRVPEKHVKLEALAQQSRRRVIKTHLPLDALVYSPLAKYIYVARDGRDGRDVVWSLYNHHANANELWYRLINDTPGRVGPPIGQPPESVRDYFNTWLERDGYPFWSYWENIRSWWAARGVPNLLILHYDELKADLPGTIDRVADFLNIQISALRRPAIIEHCTFAYMKAHSEKSAPLNGDFWEGGAQTFIHKGHNGRWRDMLTAEDCRRYEQTARRELGVECAAWLAADQVPEAVRV